MINIHAVGDKAFEEFSDSVQDLVRQAFEKCPWASHAFIFGVFIPGDRAYPATIDWTWRYDINNGAISVWSDDGYREIYKDEVKYG